jgi:hypothetical protein
VYVRLAQGAATTIAHPLAARRRSCQNIHPLRLRDLPEARAGGLTPSLLPQTA